MNDLNLTRIDINKDVPKIKYEIAKRTINQYLIQQECKHTNTIKESHDNYYGFGKVEFEQCSICGKIILKSNED